MNSRIPLGLAVIGLAAMAVPTVAHATDSRVPTICAAAAPQGIQGPIGQQGDPGDKGPDGRPWWEVPTGPSRAPHAAVEIPTCESISELCIVAVTGEIGDQGDKGDKGIPGVQGPDGLNQNQVGPSRVAHQVSIPEACRKDGVCTIVVQGPKGPKGPKGPQGVQGPIGDEGASWPVQPPNGPSRAPHGTQEQLELVKVEIPSACQQLIAASLPALPAIPATGGDSGILLQVAAGFVAVGVIALLSRRVAHR